MVKASSLPYIPDPISRFVQAHKFLRSLDQSQAVAVQVRNEALVELRKTMSQRKIAKLIGVSQQMIANLERKYHL